MSSNYIPYACCTDSIEGGKFICCTVLPVDDKLPRAPIADALKPEYIAELACAISDCNAFSWFKMFAVEDVDVVEATGVVEAAAVVELAGVVEDTAELWVVPSADSIEFSCVWLIVLLDTRLFKILSIAELLVLLLAPPPPPCLWCP